VSETLRSKTAAASLFLVRENLKDLRGYVADLNPDNIDRLVKTAELTSTTIKKLLAWLAEGPKINLPVQTGTHIDPSAVLRTLQAIRNGHTCPACGLLLREDN